MNAIENIVLPPSTRGLCLTKHECHRKHSAAIFHQWSLPDSNFSNPGGGTLPGNLRLFGKNVRFTEDRLHKHRCAYSCAKNVTTLKYKEILNHKKRLSAIMQGNYMY